MSRFFHYDERFSDIIRRSNAQLIFLGGHGGVVSYGGDGGPIRKEGAPLDRLFLLMTDGRLLGDAGLAIEFGHISFCTGNLLGEVQFKETDNDCLSLIYAFEKNEDKFAFVAKGGISELGINYSTPLVSGTVEESFMLWTIDDNHGQTSGLPYVAWHRDVDVHDALIDWFEIPVARPLAAETSWKKPPPKPTPDVDGSRPSKGLAFSTQQYLAHTRVFLTIEGC